MAKYQCVLLDRDGVINMDSDTYIRTPDEWQPIPGSTDAIAKLNKHNIKVIVVTNQSGVGRGYYTLDTLDMIHQKMNQCVEECGGHIDGIYFCPHTPVDECDCRKPKPGLLIKAMQEMSIEPLTCVLVGDSARDIEAANAAGCDAVLVETGNGVSTREHINASVPVFSDLSAWVEDYLSWQ